jgi:hypothetical protein
MKTTRTVWMMLIAGSIFASCQSNNKPVAQRADTSGSVVLNDNGDDNLRNNVTPASPDTNSSSASASTTTGTASAPTGTSAWIDTANMVCVPRHRPKPQAMAYNCRRTYHAKRHRKVTPKHIEVTENTTAFTPEPPAPVVEETTVTQPVVVEKQTEFTGNVPAPKKRSMVHFGLEGGGNLNNLYDRDKDFETSDMIKVGFHGGVNVNVEMGKRWLFQPGVRYIMKGAELTSTSQSGLVTTEHKDKLTYHYVEVPVNFVYNAGDWGTSHLIIGGGPYVSRLVNAQNKTKDKIKGPDGEVIQTGQHSVPIGNPDQAGNLRPIDAGAGAFIGYQGKSGVYIKGGAEFGLVDMERNTATLSQFKNKNYNFLLSLGYICGYKK